MPSYLIASLAGFLAGTAGAMGLGGGSILLLYLTLMTSTEQLRAQGINLLFFLPCAVTALVVHRKQGRLCPSVLLPATVYGVAGAAAGYWLGGMLGGERLGRLFGCFLVVLGLRELLHPKRPPADDA